MHKTILPLFAGIMGLTAAQDGRVTVSDMEYTIDAINGGVGGTSQCLVSGTVSRGNEPISFAIQETCDYFQNSNTFTKFADNPDLEINISCSVGSGGNDCNSFFDIEVRHTDGLCNQGRTERVDCPTTDFRRRQEPPLQESPTSCFADILLSECSD